MRSATSKFKAFDLYRSVPVDLTTPTMTGSLMSIACALVMIYLFISESIDFLSPETTSHMTVQQDEGDKLHLNFNVSFPRLPCFAFSLDVMDIMGRHEIGVVSDILRLRLDPAGNSMGEYVHGSYDQHQLRAMATEGCRTSGFVAVNKVPGNFHVSAHSSQHLVNQYMGGQISVLHEIHSLYAGEVYLAPKQYPGSLHPLDGTSRSHDDPATTYEYFLDIVPTTYVMKGNREIRAYQMTAHAHRFATPLGSHMPAVFFRYQLSPIHVQYRTKRKALSHFLTYLCAIVGGVFTVAGLLKGMIETSVVAFQKNVLGKSI